MIVFKDLRFKNFLSTGNKFTEIKLNETNTTLVLGSNGAGKSTMLDALTFVLFGKPYRKINKPQLINAANEKDMVVEVDFSIGRKEYKIVRGMKPNIFEVYIDDVMLDQDSRMKDHQKYLEENILKLNYKSFTQVVVLGSSNFTPFMQLSAADRRRIIEELLDIKIFSIMNDLLKVRKSDNKDQIAQVGMSEEIASEKQRLAKKHKAELETNRQSRIDSIQSIISEDKSAIARIQSDKDELSAKIETLRKGIINYDSDVKKLDQAKSFHSRISANRRKSSKFVSFLSTKSSCPTCTQDINKEFKDSTLTEHNSKIEEYDSAIDELDTKVQALTEKMKKYKEALDTITKWERSISSKESAIRTHNRNIERQEKEINAIKEQKGSVEDIEKELEQIKREIETLTEQRLTLSTIKNRLEIIQLLLKDSGIKTRIVKKYLPAINKLVNKYLQSMDFYVKFNLDESFRETIQTRGRENFSYASFSEGEKLRIDLSLLFTWRDIARMKNSANTNLLILDEVFDSSLDTNGTEDFLKLLQSLDREIHIWIISHKGDALVDKFDRTIRFKKVKNFSIMEEDG